MLLYPFHFHVGYYCLLKTRMLGHLKIFCRSQDTIFRCIKGVLMQKKLATLKFTNDLQKYNEVLVPRAQFSFTTST